MRQVLLKDILYMRGKDFGTSSWHVIDQAMVDSFADVAGDRQWIHTDPERAKESIFGGTIVHGYLILSLAPQLMDEVVTIADAEMGINRGLDRLRFLAPFKVGDKIRLRVVLKDAIDSKDSVDTTWVLTFEGEGYSKEICVAYLVKRWLKDSSPEGSDGAEEFVM